MGQKYASYDASGIVNGYYDSIDSPLPPGVKAIPITDAEWQEAISSPYQPVTVVGGVLSIPSGPSLAQAQATQIALLQSAFEKAEQSPVSLTLASGITASFGMTPHDWTKIVGLYSKYVVKGDSLPTPYPLLDSRNVLQYITKIDIENLYNAGEAQTVNATTKFDTLVKSVQTATTVEAIKAIVW